MINENLILLPFLAPLLGAVLCLMFWRSQLAQKIIYGIAAIVMVVSSSFLLYHTSSDIMTLQVGGWQPPYGISLVADTLSALLVLTTSILALANLIYSIDGIDKYRASLGYNPLMLFMLFGINGAFLTGDAFNLYVFFEVMLVSSFVLIVLGGSKEQLRGAISYVIINFIASSFFLAGIGILYSLTGTVNMAYLAVQVQESSSTGMITLASMFFIICFGIKAAIFPLFFWLPASYHTPPIGISAIIAGLLTKVGVYALLRFFTLIFTQDISFTHELLIILASFTMMVGVLGAIAQSDMRRIFSFLIISHIGAMIMGLAVMTPVAIMGASFYLIHSIIVKANLFYLSGIIKEARGTYVISQLGSLYRNFPVLTICFGVSAFALAGIPPLSGFWSKFLLAQGGLESEHYATTFFLLTSSILTIYVMFKVWSESFWKDAPKNENEENLPDSESGFISKHLTLYIPVVLLTVLVVAISLYPDWLMEPAGRVADELLHPQRYINAVLK